METYVNIKLSIIQLLLSFGNMVDISIISNILKLVNVVAVSLDT